MCVCVRARARACVCMCVRGRVRACAGVWAYVCVGTGIARNKAKRCVLVFYANKRSILQLDFLEEFRALRGR